MNNKFEPELKKEIIRLYLEEGRTVLLNLMMLFYTMVVVLSIQVMLIAKR